MQKKTISEINEKYDLEIERIVRTIKKEKAKKVLLQFPEGMKPYSTAICDEVEEKTNIQCFIWMGTCFGGCDIPLEVGKIGVDLIIQFGHSDWKYNRKKGINVLK
jgi:2-(3-amino-3-carboxypropyl)histidine synthase